MLALLVFHQYAYIFSDQVVKTLNPQWTQNFYVSSSWPSDQDYPQGITSSSGIQLPAFKIDETPLLEVFKAKNISVGRDLQDKLEVEWSSKI